MQQAIIIRVTAEDYDTWFKEHGGQEEAQLDFGITDGPFYRDEADPNVALVHLNVESLDRPWGGSSLMRSRAPTNAPAR